MKKIMKTLSLMFAVGAMLFGSGLHHEGAEVAKASGVVATATFGKDNVIIDSASVDFSDDQNNAWNVTVEGTTSFTSNAAYYQVGSSKKPASSIIFTHTISSDMSIDSFSIKLGGFSGTAGDITVTAGDTIIASGSLNTTSDVTVSSIESIECKKDDILKIQIDNIAKGVKVYNFSWTYTIGGTAKKLESIEVTPLKTEYTIGECISNSDVNVEGTYDDGTKAEITIFSISPSEVFVEVENNVTVTVSVGEISDTYVINVKEAPLFDKLTDSSNLSIGDKITFVSGNYAIGAQTGTYRSKVDASFNGEGKLIYTASTIASFDLLEGTATGTYSLFDGSGYLSWSSGNTLITVEEKSDNTNWKISIDEEGTATILNATDETRKLQYNASSPRFACYTSSQTGISIYKLPSGNSAYDSLVEDLLATDVCLGDSEVAADLQERYDSLTDSEKIDFQTKTCAENDSTTLYERLQYIIAVANGDASSDSLGSNLLSSLKSVNKSYIVLFVGLLGLTAILGYYFINKKKYAR